MITLGVLADTHIPDRARRLHPRILPVFQEAGVSAILHAGDISSPATLEQLKTVAPVWAVRGNRDWVLLRHLPRAQMLEFDGVKIFLTHGHGRWWNYLVDRTHYVFFGFDLQRFQPRLLESSAGADVVVYGHTHRVFNERIGGKLIFNPGSPHFPGEKGLAPTVGLLHIDGGEVEGEIIAL